jgi:hypothetical protein
LVETALPMAHGEKFLFALFYLFFGRMHNYCLLLLIWFPFVAPESSSWDLCMHATWAGSVVTETLLFHTYYSCAGSVTGSCTHNHTTYLVCSHGNQYICFSPTYQPWGQWLEIRSVHNPGTLVSCTQEYSPDKSVSMFFDACVAIDHGGCGGTGCGSGGQAWERAYSANDKYMCRRDNSRPCDDVVLIIALTGVVFHGPHGKEQNTWLSFTRGQLLLTALLAPVTL